MHVEADLQGVNYGSGKWGREDISTDFTIGRKQVVQADVTTFRMVVLVDDQVVKNYPGLLRQGVRPGARRSAASTW